MQAPRITPDVPVVQVENPARLVRLAFEGADMAPLIAAEHSRMERGAPIPAALFNLSILYQLVGRRDDALACQAAALRGQRLYACPPSGPAGNAGLLRLLVLAGPGDLMANTPVDLMLEGCAVQVTRLFVSPDDTGPIEVPDHDVALMAVGESDESRPLLEHLAGAAAVWPRPLVNDAARVGGLAREHLHRILAGAPGILIPPTERVARPALEAAAAEAGGGDVGFPGCRFPIIVRPVGSHAGKGLERVDGPAALGAYLAEAPSASFYVSPFVDYAGPDGRFRKSRIVLFDGRPFLAHMAVGDRWMVHYLNAGMAEDAAKRGEEAVAMAGFDAGFARRHAGALAALHERVGLDLFAIDCAETRDRSLLLFEADVAMVVHDLDPSELYPYKKPQMRRLFDAFEAFLRARLADHASVAAPGGA